MHTGIDLYGTLNLCSNNVIVSMWQIHPEEEDYGFEIEEKNKAIVVKSVTRGSHAEVKVITHTHTHRRPAPGR